MNDSTEQGLTHYFKGNISIKSSILARAKRDETEAITLMFRQFITEQENICLVQYLGVKGIWGIGTASFACLTDRRLVDITVGFFGEITMKMFI